MKTVPAPPSKKFSKLDVLILVELGYVPASKIGSELLCDEISSAYERQRLIVTTNLPFENWTEVLSSERLTAGATLDRLTHRCHVLEASGQSYQLRDAQRRKETTRLKRHQYKVEVMNRPLAVSCQPRSSESFLQAGHCTFRPPSAAISRRRLQAHDDRYDRFYCDP